MMKYTGIILFLIWLAMPMEGKEMEAVCYIEDGPGFPCMLDKQKGYKWLGSWHEGYVIWSSYISDNEILYLQLAPNTKDDG